MTVVIPLRNRASRFRRLLLFGILSLGAFALLYSGGRLSVETAGIIAIAFGLLYVFVKPLLDWGLPSGFGSESVLTGTACVIRQGIGAEPEQDKIHLATLPTSH